MKIILKSPSNNYICSIIIGNKIYNEWLKYSFPFVKKYCKKNKLGLIIFNKDIISKKNIYWKKPTWQKLLVGDFLKNKIKNINNICMLDVDILVNPDAPNIFKHHKENKISVISLRNKLPFSWEKAVKNISFYRNKFYSKKYPLDSAIGISVSNLYKMHNLKPQKDEFCAGVYVFNVKKFSEILKSWFYKYKKEIFSVTGGGEQTHFNYEVQNIKKENFIEYKFQAIWVFEMAINYPFLYKFKSKKNKLITESILASLQNNYFLHFAGSWYEGSMWKNSNIVKSYFNSKFNNQLINFQKKKLSGKPKGMIKP
jgi:hypothetical protein